MSPNEALNLSISLKRTEVFLGLEDSELARIASLPSCHEERYERGEVIFKADDPAKYFYVLMEGQVDLVSGIPVPGQTQGPLVERINTGSSFGWSAIVEPYYYVLSAVCSEPSRLVAIGGKELLVLFREDNRLGYEVLRSLTKIIGTRVRTVGQSVVKGRRVPFL